MYRMEAARSLRHGLHEIDKVQQAQMLLTAERGVMMPEAAACMATCTKSTR